MMTSNITRALLTLSLGSIVACGGGATFSSGVDGSKKVSELDDADAAKICAAAEETAKEWAADHKDGLCKFTGGFAGGIAAAFGQDGTAACEMAVTECEAKDPESSTGMCEPKNDNCDATITEIETCYNDSLESLGDTFDEFAGKSCADLISSTGTSLELSEPASCKAIAERCPSVSFGLVTTTSSAA